MPDLGVTTLIRLNASRTYLNGFFLRTVHEVAASRAHYRVILNRAAADDPQLTPAIGTDLKCDCSRNNHSFERVLIFSFSHPNNV